MSVDFLNFRGSQESGTSEIVLGSATATTASETALGEPKNGSKEFSDGDKLFSDFQEEEADESDECGVEYLLHRNTASFRCLVQVAMSNSSMMRGKFYHFPPLEDPGVDEAYFHQEPIKSYDNIGIEKYEDLCKELKIFPFSSVKKGLANETLNLKYYVLTFKQMKSICETLAGNAHVERLILEGNEMSPEHIEMLESMMEENTSIRYLNLRECRIGEEGAKNLSLGLAASQVLVELDLSHNSLGNRGLTNLLKGLCGTPSLMKLNLSHNEFTEECAETLEKILLENNTLKEFDLSWNFLNTGPVCKKIFHAILAKDIIKRLMLAWNGIGTRAAVLPLAKYVSHSESLEFLDLSYNRLAGPPLRRIRGAIVKNHSLLATKIGNNPYALDDAFFMASLLISKAKDPFQYLDMENILFTKEVLQLLTRIKSLGKQIKIGGILGHYTIKGPNINELLFKRCKYLLMKPKKKKARIDFGHFVLSLPIGVITKEEFATLLLKKKIKRLDKELLAELMNRFSVKKTKIDCTEMRRVYMELYPDTVLPPPKPKETKGKNKGKRKNKIVTQEKELAVYDLEGPLELPDVAVEQNEETPRFEETFIG